MLGNVNEESRDAGTRRRGDTATRGGRGDTATRGHAGTRGHGDAGDTRGRGDTGTRRRGGHAGTRVTPCPASQTGPRILYSVPVSVQSNKILDPESRSLLSQHLVDVGKNFYHRGWVLGTSGNFSAVLQSNPLHLLITPSGADKGNLQSEQILEIDEAARVIHGSGKPSAETLLHLSIVRMKEAGAVLHTHSVWSTILTDRSINDGIAIEGFEMLKGLAGVETHLHTEWLPIIENSQNYPDLAGALEDVLTNQPDCHGVLIRRHGLYTWGFDISEAKRHVEIFEFLFEVMVRGGQLG